MIANSNAYQLSSVPNDFNAADQQNYSRFYFRRLQAEVLLDAIDDLAGSQTEFPNLPTGTRAIGLPDNSYNNGSPFLKVFGRPENESVCECERVQSSSLAQSLHLMNAGDIKAKLATANGRSERLSKSDKPLEERIQELYRVAFSREPSVQEMSFAMEYLATPKAETVSKERFQDLIWALVNTKEFLFNH